jgi:hypothetical protein
MICDGSYYITKYGEPQDHTTRFALKLIISPNREDYRTTQKDFTTAYYISNWRETQDKK